MPVRNRVHRGEGRRRARSRFESGAAAVEFALVSTLLIPVMLGIVDYGLWFNDSLNARQGVREAARMGVVQNVTCSTGTSTLSKIVCLTKQQVGAVSGTSYAMVKVPQGWAKGKPLIVCAMIRSDGVTGLTPLPAGHMIKAMTQLSIEVATPVPTGATATGASSRSDTPPAGTDWSWCA